jgi:hypothetical protein
MIDPRDLLFRSVDEIIFRSDIVRSVCFSKIEIPQNNTDGVSDFVGNARDVRRPTVANFSARMTSFCLFSVQRLVALKEPIVSFKTRLSSAIRCNILFREEERTENSLSSFRTEKNKASSS